MKATQTGMAVIGRNVGELFCCFLSCYHSFSLIIFWLFVLLKGVECAISHTAIYAGQELWHFILCLWEFVSVQAKFTCIFQMLYL